MKIKKAILLLLIVIIAGIIFCFSGQDGKDSEAVSDKVTINVINRYESISDKKISETKKNEIVKNTRFGVRKMAHFAIYFLLGLVTFMYVGCYKVRHQIILTIMCIFLFACTDEIHQLFSLGRNASFLDVIIDTSGSYCGVLAIVLTNKIFKRQRRKLVK